MSVDAKIIIQDNEEKPLEFIPLLTEFLKENNLGNKVNALQKVILTDFDFSINNGSISGFTTIYDKESASVDRFCSFFVSSDIYKNKFDKSEICFSASTEGENNVEFLEELAKYLSTRFPNTVYIPKDSVSEGVVFKNGEVIFSFDSDTEFDLEDLRKIDEKIEANLKNKVNANLTLK